MGSSTDTAHGRLTRSASRFYALSGQPVVRSRRVDGADTNDNGRDFGLRRETPGTSNLGTGSMIAAYVPPDVNACPPAPQCRVWSVLSWAVW